MQYYQVPADLLEDTDALGSWVADAVGVAQRARKKPGASRSVKKTPKG